MTFEEFYRSADLSTRCGGCGEDLSELLAEFNHVCADRYKPDQLSMIDPPQALFYPHYL